MKIEIKSPTSSITIKNPNIAVQGIIRIPIDEAEENSEYFVRCHLHGETYTINEIVKCIMLPSFDNWTKTDTEYVKTIRIPIRLRKTTKTVSVHLRKANHDKDLTSDKVIFKRKYVKKTPPKDKENQNGSKSET